MKYTVQDALNKNFDSTLDYEGIRKRIMTIISKLHKLSNDEDFYDDKLNMLNSISDITKINEYLANKANA